MNPAISPTVAEVIMRSLAKEPQDRFPTASSLATALARAVETTTFTSSDSTIPRGALPKPLQTDHIVPPAVLRDTPLYPPVSLPPDEMADSQFMSPIEDSEQSTITLVNIATPKNGEMNIAQPTQRVDSAQPSPTVTPPFAKQAKRRRSKGLPVAVLITLVIALLGSSLGLGAFFWFSQHPATSSVASPIVGHAFFVSSGQLNASGMPSINDQLLINLHNLHSPAPGKVYYAWLWR
jgi:hypothetical protein